MSSGFLGKGLGQKLLGAFGGVGLAAPVPVAGNELLTNGNFSAWTGDNPDGWIISGESGSDPMITQVAAGARYYSTVGTYFALSKAGVLVAASWVQSVFDLRTLTTGEFRLANWVPTTNYAAAGVITRTDRAASTDVVLARGNTSGANDFVLASASAKRLTLASLLSTRAYAAADCDLSAAVTRTANSQAGWCIGLDNPANPQNFIIGYENGQGRVKVDKCVAGVYTNLIDAAVSYAAGRIIRGVRVGNAVSCYYNGAQVGATVTVADAGIVNNKNHGLFSTYAANTFANYSAV